MKTTKPRKSPRKSPRKRLSDKETGVIVQALAQHHAAALQFVDWSTEGDANWLHNRALTVIRYILNVIDDRGGDHAPSLEDMNRQYGDRQCPINVTKD